MERLGITLDRSLNAAKKSCTASSSKLPRPLSQSTYSISVVKSESCSLQLLEVFIQKIMND